MYKKGNVEIIFLMFIATILIMLCFLSYMIYVQIVTYIIPIKQDLFYIVQNSYFSLNEENLEYSEYIVDNNKLKNKVNNILKINYRNCTVKSISYDSSKNKVYIEVIVSITPVVFKDNIDNLKLTVKDEFKLKTMEVK